MNQLEKKCAPSSFLENTAINLTPEQLMTKRFPITNPDRYAIMSYIMDKKKTDKLFVRIYGCYPTVRECEEVIRGMAMADKLNSNRDPINASTGE